MTVITISGPPGSGKSTVGRLLEKKLGLEYIYSGMLFRKQAEKHNMSLSEFSKYCEKNEEIDKKLDEHQLKLLKKGNIILEGRLAGWLAYKNSIPALKVMLDADIETRAKRITKRGNADKKNKKKEIIKREKSEALRYKKYYNIDLKDKSIYDLIIDTKNKKPEEIANIIIQHI